LNVKGYLKSLLDELSVSLSVQESRFLVMLEFEWEADTGWTELSLTRDNKVGKTKEEEENNKVEFHSWGKKLWVNYTFPP
jgi:hypothetical protein